MIVTSEMFDDVRDELEEEKREKVSKFIKDKYRRLEYIEAEISELERRRAEINEVLDEIDGMEIDEVIAEYGDKFSGTITMTLSNPCEFNITDLM